MKTFSVTKSSVVFAMALGDCFCSGFLQQLVAFRSIRENFFEPSR